MAGDLRRGRGELQLRGHGRGRILRIEGDLKRTHALVLRVLDKGQHGVLDREVWGLVFDNAPEACLEEGSRGEDVASQAGHDEAFQAQWQLLSVVVLDRAVQDARCYALKLTLPGHFDDLGGGAVREVTKVPARDEAVVEHCLGCARVHQQAHAGLGRSEVPSRVGGADREHESVPASVIFVGEVNDGLLRRRLVGRG